VSIRVPAGFLLLLSILWLAGSGPAQAQQTSRPFGKVVEEWNRTFDLVAGETAGPELTESRAEKLKDRLAKIETEAREIKAKAQVEMEPIQGRLDALGPPPGEDDPPEAEEIAEQRRKIGEEITFYEARVKQADLALARAQELQQEITSRTLARSIEQLSERFPFPLAPDTVATAIPEFFRTLALIARSPVEWWGSLNEVQKEQVVFYRFALVVLFAVIFGWGIRRALLHWLGRDPAMQEPSYTRRLTGAISDGLAHGIVPSLILAGFMVRVLSGESLISGRFAEVVVNFCAVTIMFILAWALPRAVLAPDLPAWRLIPVSAPNARRLSRRVTFLAAVFAVDLFLGASSRDLVLSKELVSLYTLFSKILEAGVILALMQGRLWAYDETAAPDEAEGGTARSAGGWGFWATIRRAISLIAVAVALTALGGYASASTFLAENLVISGMIVGVLVLLRGLLRELIGVALRSGLLQAALAIPHKARSRYKFWLRGLLDLGIYLGGLVLILIVWGVAPRDIWSWAGKTWRGVTIGNVTISLGDILVAIAVFVVTLTVTRMIQRFLTERVFPHTDLDMGVRNSLSTGLGYTGLVLALALAIAAVGFDLSNIAIIAGALSVGIGFGLQNVVNNFVSGLILLIERPIKVGDWIMVGGNEGYVRRINVRSTEIETFRRAAVIVPNSEFISSAVTNWTYKDRFGRVEVPVGVAYGSDVAQVMDVLQRCLEDHESILAQPEPYVLFKGFGDSSLDFEARGHIANVEYRVVVQSDLRFAIYQAFEAAGIEIPFPQRDLHIKGVENLNEEITGRAPGDADSPRSGATPTTRQVRTGPSGAEE
jgi:small-conductance mechanosensitive channel